MSGRPDRCGSLPIIDQKAPNAHQTCLVSELLAFAAAACDAAKARATATPIALPAAPEGASAGLSAATHCRNILAAWLLADGLQRQSKPLSEILGLPEAFNLQSVVCCATVLC